MLSIAGLEMTYLLPKKNMVTSFPGKEEGVIRKERLKEIRR